MKYIYGIIENCFNSFYVFRGFAKPKDIIKYSVAYSGYQRCLNDEHTRELASYFADGISVFSPEVVFAYSVEDWWEESINPTFHGEAWCGGGVSPIDYLAGKQGSKGRVALKDYNGITFTKMSPPKGSGVNFVKISLPDNLTETPFRRIDGNHRLEAMTMIDKEKAEYSIPICIILLRADFFEGRTDAEIDTAIIEMDIFHNINSKAKPLTEIEQYRGFLNLLNVEELRKFGQEFAITKDFLDNHDKLPLTNLHNPFEEKDDIVLSCVKFLLDGNIEITAKELAEIFTVLNNTYFENYPLLRDFKNKYAFIPYMYYLNQGQRKVNPKLDAYNTWFIKNRLYEMKDLDPASMIAAFDSIYQIRQKQIFVAMPFEDRLDFVFAAICEVVEQINDEYNIELPTPVRIDKQILGFSYDIVNEILDKIENCGLLIADLTGQNANVYYEVGFAQGLIRAKLGNSARVLYLINDPKKPEQPFDAAKFDVNHYKILPYKDKGMGYNDLKMSLEVELRAFYGI